MQHLSIRDYEGETAGHVDSLEEFAAQEIAAPSAQQTRIALVGTFAPRECGIATFTGDIVEHLAIYHPEIGVDVYAIDRRGSRLVYERPKQVIAVDDAESYASAAHEINASGVSAVWIQHEYGIFGEDDGEAVCNFVDQIAVPLIFTFHTVLSSPSPRQRRILRHLVRRASRIMVMSQEGRDLLNRTYGAPTALVALIPHGAPDRPFGRTTLFKQRLGLEDHDVLMTFGLLAPGKGLENMIKALPAIIARHPKAIYHIIGVTHPNLLTEQGEAYREELQALAAQLGVEDKVTWDNRFLDTDDLLDQLEACDIYVTPYLDLQQSTSGTLSYAVALGKAVVSTPYVHARELLTDGVGVLIDPDSPNALADAITDLLDDQVKLTTIQRKAYKQGRRTIWPEFARASAVLISESVHTVHRTAIYDGLRPLCYSRYELQHGISAEDRYGRSQSCGLP